ncbi:MAG: enoyl-CoA hydratase [Acidimicrobiia bacterium]
MALVESSTEGRIRIVTINRPDQRNAISPEVSTQLEAAISEFEKDNDVWVGIITGAGDKAFSAGADLKAIAAGRMQEIWTAEGGFAGITKRSRTKPIIAAVNGDALAGGCEIALACDLIVAAEHARFGLPEVRRSLIAAAGGLFRLPRRLPLSVAMEMILTGLPISARRAYELGLVNRVVPADQVMSAAMELAGAIAECAPVAVRESRRVVVESLLASEEDRGWELSARATATVVGTEDFLEGPRAFVEKREPRWKGR